MTYSADWHPTTYRMPEEILTGEAEHAEGLRGWLSGGKLADDQFHANQDCLGRAGCRWQCEHLAEEKARARINAQVKAVGASATVPLNVAGTVDVPLLYPTGGTMAGAVAGTVILGPGFGTSAGAKVGS